LLESFIIEFGEFAIKMVGINRGTFFQLEPIQLSCHKEIENGTNVSHKMLGDVLK